MCSLLIGWRRTTKKKANLIEVLKRLFEVSLAKIHESSESIKQWLIWVLRNVLVHEAQYTFRVWTEKKVREGESQ
jgi:hypothetical protein